MKIIAVKPLTIADIKVIRYARFSDERGYFSETYRKSILEKIAEFKTVSFVQHNESFSQKNVIRGLHFQFNPYMGKLVRPLMGNLIDLALDIRQGSPYYGKIIAYNLTAYSKQDYGEWIWLPPGFAHGVCFTQESTIEYLCTGEYNPNCEVSISPLAPDIDWSLCDPILKQQIEQIKAGAVISQKDTAGLTITQWSQDPRATYFRYDH